MWRRSEGWRDSATFLRQPRSGPGRRGAPSCLVDPAPDADSESSLAGEIGQPRPASPRVTPEPHPTGPTHWPAEERSQAGSPPPAPSQRLALVGRRGLSSSHPCGPHFGGQPLVLAGSAVSLEQIARVCGLEADSRWPRCDL